MVNKGPWLLALALELLGQGKSDQEVVQRLVEAAQGSREGLRGAYARALALASELPDDGTARQLVDLLSRAMRRTVGARPGRSSEV